MSPQDAIEWSLTAAFTVFWACLIVLMVACTVAVLLHGATHVVAPAILDLLDVVSP